jgi:hypothetical protein
VSYVTFPKVSDVINGVSQDIRNQLSASASTAGQPILIDYTNRTHKGMLRFSRWGFLLSQDQFFITLQGESQYWLGPKGQGPPGTVDTGLNLQDMDKIKKDSVVDLSNVRGLKWLSSPPYGPNLNSQTGSGLPGQPATWRQDPNNPNVLAIFPPPNNQNTTQPTTTNPICAAVPGGALAQRTYLVKYTLVDRLGGESSAPIRGTQQFIPANNLLTVKSPANGMFGQLPFSLSQSGLPFDRYNVYVVQATIAPNNLPSNEGAEILQNATPIPIGTDFVEPNTGLLTTGASVPLLNTLQFFGGYIVKFQYYKGRVTLKTVDQFLQIPDDYFDIVVQGVQALAFKILGKEKDAAQSFQLYREGLREMITDKNLFPEGVEFIRPDSNTFVNQQILGYLPPFF